MPHSTPSPRAEKILERIKDAYILLDDAWHIIEVNKALTDLAGRPRESLLGVSHWEAFPASRTNKAWNEYHRVRDSGQEAHFTEHYVGEGYDHYLDVDAYPTEE
jgi:PAS domain S-box-containing protein